MKKSRFRDVSIRPVSLKKADKVVFFAPHTSEHFATGPLISRLSERLKKEGKEVKKEVIEDMRLRVLRTTCQISEKDVPRDPKLIEKLFRLEDTWIRLQKLGELIERNPDGVILEVHALDKDYYDKSEFLWVDYFYRLPDTRVLVIRDLMKEYEYPIKEGLKSIDSADERHMAIVGCFSELVLKRVAEEYSKLLGILSDNIERVSMIEIPAPSYSKIRRTGIGLIDRMIMRYFDLPAHLTKFEEAHGISVSMEAKLTDADIDGILKMISGQ